jgi:cytochrome c-type biogenesis protein
MAGVGMNRISDGGEITGEVRTRAVVTACFFSAGVIVIFLGLGATATVFGQLVREWFDVLRWIAAGIIFVMGLHFLGVVRIGLLYRQFRAEPGQAQGMSLAGAFVIGAAFAFGWTPCVGPVLAAILFTAAGAETVSRGMVLLLVYGLGMTLPFVLAALFIGPFMRWMRGFRRWLPVVEKAMGVLLIAFAVLIGTNTINWTANWMLEAAPGLWLLL